MNGLCRDCKWWREQLFNDKHFCALHLKSNNGLAYAESHSTAWLITKPDFGCNQHERKDQAELREKLPAHHSDAK